MSFIQNFYKYSTISDKNRNRTKGDIVIYADLESVATALQGILLHTPGFTKKHQENKDICDPLHRSLGQYGISPINVIFQFPSSNKTGGVYTMPAGDYF